jgi:Fe-S cluster assembly protein SufD
MSASLLTETPPACPAGLDEAAFAALAAAGGPPALQAAREEAFAVFRELPLPRPTDEEWRRTDPELFPLDAFRRLPDLRPAGGEARVCELGAHFEVAVTVDDGAYAIADREGAVAAGRVTVMALAEAAERRPDLLAHALAGVARPPKPRKFTSLVEAFWNFGLLIHVPAGARLERGVLVRYRHTAASGLFIPRIVIVVEDGASATVAEHYASDAAAPLLAVGSREMAVGAGAQLKLVSLQEWGGRTLHIGEDWSRVGRDGRIDWVTLTLGGKASKLVCGCDVAAPGAEAWLSGLYFADGKRHVDQRTVQQHSSPHTRSSLLYKGAVKDDSHSVYQGVIAAGRGAVKVDAYQMNKNLVLGEGARADSLPGLEIDADDLKCSHGATSGTLDDAQLFYLQSRGIPADRARQMLVNAFFEEVIARVPFAFMQERVREHVERSVR